MSCWGQFGKCWGIQEETFQDVRPHWTKSKSLQRFSLLHVLMPSLFLLPQVTTSCQTSTNHELVSVETRLLLSWECILFFLLLGRLSWKTEALRSSDAAFDPYVMDTIVHYLTGAEQRKSNVVFKARRLRLTKKKAPLVFYVVPCQVCNWTTVTWRALSFSL